MEFKEYSVRGFVGYGFTDSNGVECSIQESSSVDGKIWLGINNADPKILKSVARELSLPCAEEGNGWQSYPVPEQVQFNDRMHLTVGQVEALLPKLIEFVKTTRLS